MSCLWSWCFKTDVNKTITPRHHRNQQTQEIDASEVHAGERFENSDLVDRVHSDVLPERDDIYKSKHLRPRPYTSAK